MSGAGVTANLSEPRTSVRRLGGHLHEASSSSATGPRHLILRAALLSLAACGGDEPAYTKLFTTEHFVYYAEEGAASPCEDAAQQLEHHYEANSRFLGATLPPGVRIEYYLAANLDTVPCSSFGCAMGTEIHSVIPVHAHELVHANAFLAGNPPALFKEGLAVLLSCGTFAVDAPLDLSHPIEGLVENGAFISTRDASGTGMYDASASFVRYLIDEFGVSRFLSFYARAPEWGARGVIDAVFQADFGIALDDAFADWRAKPRPHLDDPCLFVSECDPSTPLLVDSEVTLGCPPSGVSSGAGREALRRVEVPNEHIVGITTEVTQQGPPTDFAAVAFFRCDGGNVIGRPASAKSGYNSEPVQPPSAFVLDVPPGEYFAFFAATGEARVRVELEERQSPMRNPPCEPAEEPLILDDNHSTTLTSRWVERPCEGPWCPGQGWDVSIGAMGGALEAETLMSADFSPHELYICSEPCPQDAGSCEVVALNDQPARSKQTFAPGTVLHLGAPAAADAGYFAVTLRVAPELD